MMSKVIYTSLCTKKANGKKSFAVLISPDIVNDEKMEKVFSLALAAEVDYFLVCGSLVINEYLDKCFQSIKSHCNIPVLLFPVSATQVSKFADAYLYLFLISGRNPELLIGQHVVSAFSVKESGLKIMSTGYIVVNGGAQTSFSYMSIATALPAYKNDIAMCTAMAGERLGTKIIYMDAGSCAKRPITESMKERQAEDINAPYSMAAALPVRQKHISSVNPEPM